MDKYVREERIGQGGFGKVYRARVISSGTLVAMKKLTGQTEVNGADPSALREIRALKEISHANVVGFVDAFVHKTKLWIVYEFAPQDLGRTLRDPTIVRSHAHVKAWAKMMLEGLAFLHENFFIHRDIKPSNLLIATDGVLKLGDFGLCRTYGSPSSYPMTPEVVTRWYRAPELLFGAKIYTPAIDVWSAGCIIAELLTGTVLFDGTCEIDQVSKITFTLGNVDTKRWPGVDELPSYIEFEAVGSRKVPLRERLKAAPLDAVELIEQMLQYNPASRPDARKCLSNVYFRNPPQPTAASDLPMSVLRNE